VIEVKGKDEFQFRLLMGHGLLSLRQLRKLGDVYQDKPVRVINIQHHPWQQIGDMPVRDALKKFK